MAKSETDTEERMGLAEGGEPAAAEQDTAEEAKPLRVTQRMALMRIECDNIGKTDIAMQGKDGGKPFVIKGHTIEAVLAETRPLLHRHGLGLTPNLVERTYSGNRCDVIVDWEFEGLELGDTKMVRWAGSGTDNSDKAFSKAGTNSLKEMLKKVFQITDREDAKEETDSVEHQTDEGIRRADLEEARRERQAAIQQWAAAFKSALENARSVKDIGRLQSENAEQLASADLPDVTRKFFFDLIQARKKSLAETEAENRTEVV